MLHTEGTWVTRQNPFVCIAVDLAIGFDDRTGGYEDRIGDVPDPSSSG